jgi:hypothetical protein
VSRAALAAILGTVLPLAAQEPIQTFRLPTGLTCILVENHERPLIRAELLCRWQLAELPAGKEGLGGFLAAAMAAGGAGSSNRAGFLRAVDGLGATFTFQARMGSYRWDLTTDSRVQEAALDLLVDAAARPVLDGPQVETLRQALIKDASRTPRELAAARFMWDIQDPGTLLAPVSTAVERIEYLDLQDFRRRVIRPENSVLAFYGDLNLDQARQLALMHLGIWQPSAQPPIPGAPDKAVPHVPEPKLAAVLGADPATECWAGASRPPSGSSPAAEELLPWLLARTSRTGAEDVPLTIQLAPEGRSLVLKARLPQDRRDLLLPGFLAALERMRRDGCDASDLEHARSRWRAANTALTLHPEALLDRLTAGRLDPALAKAVGDLTVADLNQAIRAWLAPERLRYLLLGADAAMVQQAEKAGLGPASTLGGDR